MEITTNYMQKLSDDLLANIKGQIIYPDDKNYDQARLVWNGMIDRYPAVIVRCSTVDDVILAIKAAKARNLEVSVRGGGHNVAGHATNDDGMVIDLSLMNQVIVDPENRTVMAQAGATWADVDRETQVFGLATPGGEVSETGIAGLTLGGGMGYLRRKYGLTIDNLLSVDIVTANSELLHASENENSDLFWAVRGGGGNFGIVTRFEYQLHPVGPEVATIFQLYPMDQAQNTFRAWRDYTLNAPDEVSSAFICWSVPAIDEIPEELHHIPVVGIDAMYSGWIDEADAVLAPLHEIGTPLLDFGGVSSYLEAQSSFDAFVPAHTQRYYWKSLSFAELSDDAIDQIILCANQRPSLKTLFVMRHLGGAMGRVLADATAFGDRSAQYNVSLDSTWVNPEDDDRNIIWTRSVWDKLQQHSNGGVYLNFPGLQEECEQLIRRQFGKNYEKLAEIKKQYDPKNFFHINQNILPE